MDSFSKKRIMLRLRQGIRKAIFLAAFGALIAAGFNEIRPNGLQWSGTWSASSVAAYHLRGVDEISFEKACSLYREGHAVLLDARDPPTFEKGHIDGALNVPPSEAEDHLQYILALVKSGFEVIAYCDGEDCPLSPELARIMQKLGIPSVKVLVDGWSRWRKAGCPVQEEHSR